ncbi:MAG: methyltransferase regulatory domain-containing protein, partial [Aestuariivirga sp.]|nr:methyltransferase regulatory domain-containing protein [Aestuariivirga sp.]
WRQGYKTETDYTFGFYSMLNPDALMMTSVFLGYQPPAAMAARGEGSRALTYCELGCGQGLTLNVMAARDPGGQYYGIDYNPSQIRNARALAKAAGIDNVHFIEESFGNLDLGSLPEFDIIVLHGIYSWVSASVRQNIVDIIRRKLKPGGLCYVSYNCAVGRSADEAMRQMLIAVHRQAEGSIVQKAEASVREMQSIAKMDAQYFASNTAMTRHLATLHQHQPSYVVHEYLNEIWQPFFFSDVARDMDGAKASFIGQADLRFNRVEFCLTQQGRKVHERMTTLPDRELVKDVWVNQRFRQDIYMKGGERITLSQQVSLLSAQNFRLKRARADCALHAKVPAGTAALPADPYGRMLDMMAAGPAAGDALRAVFDGKANADRRFLSALEALVALNYIELALDPAQKTLVRPRLTALGQAIGGFISKSMDVYVLPTLANGLARSVGIMEYFLYQAHKADPARRPELAAEMLLRSGRSVSSRSAAGKPAASKREAATVLFARSEKDFVKKGLPLLESLEAL